MTEQGKVQAAIRAIRHRTGRTPKIGVILGSGLGALAEEMKQAATVPFEEIPHFPVSTVAGHKGRFVITEDVCLMQGRVHYYEGYPLSQVVFPVRVMAALGVKTLLVTNACGGVLPEMRAGDFMVITDHINLMGANPLVGPNMEEFGTRFPDMSEAYSRRLRSLILAEAERLGIGMHEGVYAAFSGPSYETPAEVRMAGILGASAVGMSTAPEVIAARHMGLETAGISLITNLAAGVSETPLSHEEVTATAERVKEPFSRLLAAVLQRLLEQE